MRDWRLHLVDWMKETQNDMSYGFDVPMASRTTFRVGGPADALVEPATMEQSIALLEWAKYLDNVPVTVIGGGSNLLVLDGGIEGLVVVIGERFASYNVHATSGVVRAEAGVRLSELSRAAAEVGLGGLEFASGIPGTLGGALVMNAGAYGSEMDKVVTRVQAYGLAKLPEYPQWIDKSDLAFGYRHSIFLEQQQAFLIGSVELQLLPGQNSESIKATMRELALQRNSKQPLMYPSAGSSFKRPEGHFAGQLIETAGLKGYRVGDAQVSELHAGFILNVGNASADDIVRVLEHVRHQVLLMHGVELELELRILGTATKRSVLSPNIGTMGAL